jgi:hypothetical protein
MRAECVVTNQEVTETPLTREDSGVPIIPVLEEIVVVEKRLLLKKSCTSAETASASVSTGGTAATCASRC